MKYYNKLILLFSFALFLILISNIDDEKSDFYNTNSIENLNNKFNDDLPELSEANHVYDWNLTWGYTGGEVGYEIALDSSENIYIAGRTNSIGAGGNDLCLIKYSNSGHQQWNVTWGGSGAEYCRDMVIDSLDNIYIVGYTNSFGSGEYEICLVKYNSSGDQQWNRTWGAYDDNFGYSITLDSSDNIYITGEVWFSFAAHFDICLLKYNSSGTLQWSKTWGIYECYEGGHAIALDSYNNIYITGYRSSSTFPDTTKNLLLVKFDNLGNEEWSKTWGGNRNDAGNAIAIDSSNYIYVAGYTFDNDLITPKYNLCLLKYNSQGTYEWAREWGDSDYSESGFAITLDWLENIYVAGETESYGAGGKDVCIIQYNSSGSFQWYKTWGGTGNDIGRSIVFDDTYNFYLGGNTNSFGAGSSDICIVKYLEKNQNHPILSLGSVSPSNSDQSSLYNFSVIYTDIDNDSPIFVNLTINETIYSMEKVNINDNDYIDGCVFQYLTYLVPAKHNYTYFFDCQDYRYSNSTITYNNLFVNETNYDIPSLIKAKVIPEKGNYQNIFNFTVWYTDKDNNLPTYVNITINNTIYPMIQINPLDNNAMDGIQFYFNTSLAFGNYKFQINCSDGFFTNATDWIYKPEVNPFYGIGSVSLLNPLNTTNIFTGNINFTWVSLELMFGSVNYTLQISNLTNFSEILYERTEIKEMPVVSNLSYYLAFQSGLYYWRVQPTYNNFKGNWSEYFILNLTYNEFIPNLTFDSVNPKIGDQFTEFNFTVIYSDFDNNPPKYVNITINGTSNLMHKVVPSDNNFVDGCLYQFLTYLSPEQYNYTYFFVTHDYKYLNSTKLKNDLLVNESNNYKPTLINPQVTPEIANLDKIFNFSVWYFDNDNNLPTYVNITINDTTYPMDQIKPLDDNSIDGIQFSFTTSLTFGYYKFQVNCSDKKFTNSTNWIPKPEINPFYHLHRNGIVLNEISKGSMDKDSWIELYNFAPDRTMTGWQIRIYVDYNSGATDYIVYNFPSGSIFTHKKIMIVCQDLIPWFNNHIAIGLLDSSSKVIDWFEEDGYDWIRPSGIEWEKDKYIYIYSESSAYRKEDLDTNNASDWTTPFSGHSRGSLNPGQTGEGHYIDLSFPAENETIYLGEINFTWSNLDSFYGNLNYSFQLSNFSDFSNIIIEIKDILQGSSLFTTISLFINLQTDQYYWRIRPTYGIFKGNWSINYSLNVIGNDHPPKLVDSKVTPKIGDTFDIFNFTVWYFDEDNSFPSHVNITINDTIYSMSRVNPFDTFAIDGIQYYFTTLLDLGYYQFQINCSDGIHTNATNWITGPEVTPFSKCENIDLLGPENFATLFTGIINFTWSSLEILIGDVNYTIQISNTPDFSIIIYTLEDINETDTISNLTIYLDLPTDQYYWRVRATYKTFYGNWSNIFSFNFTHTLFSPRLMSGSVNPKVGDQFTEFVFTVVYFDEDNNFPIYLNLTINSTSYMMNKLNPLDNDYSDGCIYYFSSYLPFSIHNYTYFFNCSDGKYGNFTAVYSDLKRIESNDNIPSLINSQFSPNSGNILTNFNFSIWYLDNDNNFPLYVNITINNNTYSMVQVNPLDTNAIDGIQYYYITSLNYGSYKFQINCSDGLYAIATGWIVGPNSYYLSRNAYAVIIGIEDYPGEGNDLDYCEDDALLIYSFLIGVCHYKPNNIILLINSEATRSVIYNAISNVRQKCKPEDVFFFYYAGHGGMDIPQVFITPYDFDDIYDSTFESWISNINCKERYIILDSCNSGGFTSSNGEFYMTSCAASESCLEDPGLSHGIFTYYFGLAHYHATDINGDGVKSLEDCFPYISSNTIARSSTLGDTHHPQKSDSIPGQTVLYPSFANPSVSFSGNELNYSFRLYGHGFIESLKINTYRDLWGSDKRTKDLLYESPSDTGFGSYSGTIKLEETYKIQYYEIIVKVSGYILRITNFPAPPPIEEEEEESSENGEEGDSLDFIIAVAILSSVLGGLALIGIAIYRKKSFGKKNALKKSIDN